MTRCSDEENEEQSDCGVEKHEKAQKKRGKGRKHVSFPPDEHIVSSFPEQKNSERNGEQFFLRLL